MGSHIVDGKFQSDKYPTCPPGKVPLSVEDVTAQDLLWEYSMRHRAVDAEFSDDLEAALTTAGFTPPTLDGANGEVTWARGLARMWMKRALDNYGRIQALEAELEAVRSSR